MGPNKDEILKRAQEAFDQEQRRRDIEARDQKPTKMTSSMPIGCWFWILAGLALAFWLIKKYGLGI